jgi:hypothetical protein
MRVNWDEASPGLSQSLRALAGGYAGRGFDDQMTLESQLAQRLQAIEQSRAQAALDAQRQDEIKAKMAAMARRPELARRFGANAAGMSPDAYAGNVGNVEAGRPIAVADEAAQMSRFANPAELRRFQSAIAQQLALEGDANWNADQIAKARGEYQEQDRTGGMVAGDVDPMAVWRAAFANKGGSRYGVQGDEMIDQLAGFGGQTKQGRSKITENLAQAGASSARAAKTKTEERREKFVIRETEGPDGPMLERVPVEGPAGPISTTGRPRPRRDPADIEIEGEYRDTFGRDPALRETGQPTPIEYKAAAKRFSRDSAMKDAERGKWVPGKGFEVFRGGKLVGYYD